jgi:hypothetical protein
MSTTRIAGPVDFGDHKHTPTFLGFVVPCIFKYSIKTPNQMHQSIVTFIV